jgi:hypothetical protein
MTGIITVLIIVLTMLSVPTLEIIYDHSRWKKNKSDKHISTILRCVAFLIIGTVFALTGLGGFFSSIFLSAATHLFFFDNALNITRWKTLKRLNLSYNWRIAHGIELNKRQKILWKIEQFLNKLYYHSKKGTDKIYANIPWFAETFFKSIILGIAIYLFI